MQGYPKNLNTKEDYLYVREKFDKSLWEKDFQDLIDTSTDWFDVGEVESLEAGTTDATHRVIEQEGEDGKVAFMQQELKVFDTCKMLQLGFTKEELEGYLA